MIKIIKHKKYQTYHATLLVGTKSAHNITGLMSCKYFSFQNWRSTPELAIEDLKIVVGEFLILCRKRIKVLEDIKKAEGNFVYKRLTGILHDIEDPTIYDEVWHAFEL